MDFVRTSVPARRLTAAAAATLFAGLLLTGSIGGSMTAEDDRAVKGAEQHSTQLAGGNKPKYTNP
jgi:hypothetical protein